jgi:hypothetical protein
MMSEKNESEVVDGSEVQEVQEGQERQFSQCELNSLLASEKRRAQSKMLESERAALEATRRAEELQLQLDKVTLSSEELHRKELSKLSSAYEEKLTVANQRATALELSIKNSAFESSVSAACLANGAVSAGVIAAILRDKGVEHGDDGPCIRMGEELVPVALAVEGLVKTDPNLFKSGIVSGVSSNSGVHIGLGRPLDFKNMSQEQYLKIRKEHPELLGLRRKK